VFILFATINQCPSRVGCKGAEWGGDITDVGGRRERSRSRIGSLCEFIKSVSGMKLLLLSKCMYFYQTRMGWEEAGRASK